MVDIEKLQAMLAAGQDNALLHFTLGNALHRDRRFLEAIPHLARAVALDPGYSAAWKQYGRCLMDSGDVVAAAQVLDRGIEVARERGDMQALREMTVFRRRLSRDG